MLLLHIYVLFFFWGGGDLRGRGRGDLRGRGRGDLRGGKGEWGGVVPYSPIIRHLCLYLHRKEMGA